MLLGDVFVKVSHREVRAHLALESNQQFHGFRLDAFAVRSSAR
jgi:hypothetical protein